MEIYHNYILETKTSLAIWAFIIICKGSDDKVATEQLTALVDVTFMLHTIIWLIL